MPDIRFARSGDVSVAYTTFGDGPIDVVWVAGAYSHLEIGLEFPGIADLCRRMAEFCRLIMFDKRGMGMSDRVVVMREGRIANIFDNRNLSAETLVRTAAGIGDWEAA